MTTEVVPFIYASTTFCFETMKVINKFLDLASSAGICSITSLEISHSNYGEPELTIDCKWKDIHDKKWLQTCQRMATMMPKVQNLSLHYRICDWPTQLSLKSPWAKPLKALKANRGFDYVRATIKHDSFSPQRLRAISRSVENEMMTPAGKEKRDTAEAIEAVRQAELKDAQARKAKKVLIIKNVPPSQKKQPNNPPVKIVRTKGLEQYTRIRRAQPPVGLWVNSNQV